MKITKFKMKTKKGELIKLEEIKTVSFGIMTDDKYSTETKEIFIISKQGHLRFPLDEVIDISFILQNEKINCSVMSSYSANEE